MVGRLIALSSVLVAAVAAPAAAARRPPAATACPPGTPTQTITVINQARVRPRSLARMERAASAQSLQLRSAWGTPCARFAAGGWRLYLKGGGSEPHGEHDFYGQPYALVWTAGATVDAWSRDFSHEVVEMLEDPTLDVRYTLGGSTWQREISDPVAGSGYRLDGVWVSDFVLPDWYAGATSAADVACMGSTCIDHSPLIAPAQDAGPWDEMHVLSAPWQISGGSTT